MTQDVLEWLSIPAWVTGLGVPLLLWLRGTLVLRTDHQAALTVQDSSHADALKAKDDVCAAELQAVQVHAESQVAAERAQRAALQDRIDHLVPDRDAWREAHREEALARQASERAAAALMETGQISLALLAALKDALSGKPAG